MHYNRDEFRQRVRQFPVTASYSDLMHNFHLFIHPSFLLTMLTSHLDSQTKRSPCHPRHSVSSFTSGLGHLSLPWRRHVTAIRQRYSRQRVSRAVFGALIWTPIKRQKWGAGNRSTAQQPFSHFSEMRWVFFCLVVVSLKKWLFDEGFTPLPCRSRCRTPGPTDVSSAQRR